MDSIDLLWAALKAAALSMLLTKAAAAGARQPEFVDVCTIECSALDPIQLRFLQLPCKHTAVTLLLARYTCRQRGLSDCMS